MRSRTSILGFMSYIMIFLVGFAVAGCNSPNSNQSIKKAGEVDDNPKIIAGKFIIAEYQGDKATLLSITREEASEAVKRGEFDFLRKHVLHKIVTFKFDSINAGLCNLTVTVSSKTPQDVLPSTYYELMKFKKFNGKWFLVKVERDI